MFSLSFIKKANLELFSQLNSEFEKIASACSKKSILVFKKYSRVKSLAGMEVWLESWFELQYFSELKSEIVKNQKNIEKYYQEYKSKLISQWKEEFGEEDFRFIEVERESKNTKDLLRFLNQLCKKIEISLNSINKQFLKEPALYEYFWKANDDPSQKGVDIELIQHRLPGKKKKQILRAEEILAKLWPEGFAIYSELTYRIVPVQSNGLVSYSHFTQPGISYINVLDRSLVETIDDLVHENSHHHLNLILKKYKILKKKETDMRYYSPWRDSLRSLYAILHAVFTFSFGAKLFFQILKNPQSKQYFSDEEWEFIHFRFCEETIMLEYSFFDLKEETDKFTNKGRELVENLFQWNEQNLSFLPSIERKIQEKDKKRKIYDLRKKMRKIKKEFGR